jgi:plastocyanin
MLTKHLRAAAAALAIAACGDGGTNPGAEFTLEMTPATATLFSAAPSNSVALAVVAKNGSGQVVTGGTRSFATASPAVATVGADGVVTAVGPGTAQITASVTIDGATKSATTTVTVEEADATATVTAPAFVYDPPTVDIRSGGSVTWSIEAIHHTVTFTTAGAPADIPELMNSTDSRTFPTSGVYAYRCDFHPAMSGTVRVH